MTYRDEVLADSPINYWEMNTGVGTDSGSSNKTLTLNGITTGVVGKQGNAWSFDGNDYAQSPTLSAIGSTFTIETWVNLNVNAKGTNRIIEWLAPLVCFYIAGYYPNNSSQQGRAGCHINGTELYGTSRIDDGDWHHVVFTKNGTIGKIYVDGVLQSTGTVANVSLSAKTVTVGSSGPTVAADFMVGAMDELAIYSTELSAARIKAHFDATVAEAVTTFRGWSVPL